LAVGCWLLAVGCWLLAGKNEKILIYKKENRPE